MAGTPHIRPGDQSPVLPVAVRSCRLAETAMTTTSSYSDLSCPIMNAIDPFPAAAERHVVWAGHTGLWVPRRHQVSFVPLSMFLAAAMWPFTLEAIAPTSWPKLTCCVPGS